MLSWGQDNHTNHQLLKLHNLPPPTLLVQYMINLLLLLYWRLDNRLDHLSTCCYFLWAELVLHLLHQILPVPGVYFVSCFAVLELRFRPWGESAAMMMELKLRAEKSSSGRIMINYCNSNKLCIMYVWTNRRYKIVYFENDYGSKKSKSLKGVQKGVYAKYLVLVRPWTYSAQLFKSTSRFQ